MTELACKKRCLTKHTKHTKLFLQSFLKKTILLALILQLGAGCVPFWKRPKPAGPPELPSATQETWCYKTLAKIDCYAGPQNFEPDRLVGVQPPIHMPRTQEAYKKALRESLAPQIDETAQTEQTQKNATPSPVASPYPATPPQRASTSKNTATSSLSKTRQSASKTQKTKKKKGMRKAKPQPQKSPPSQ